MNKPARLRRRVFTMLVILVALAAVAVAIRYQGLVFPVRVASGSMADYLIGPHRVVQCWDCKFTFRFGVASEPPLGLATCPNCGFGQIELDIAPLEPGERVLIDRWAYWWTEPRRRDVVALVDPSDETQLAVKRIVGLPSETVAIRGGELFIDGQLYRKSFAEARESAILVYDDDFRARGDGVPSRWQPDRASSGWHTAADGFSFEPADAESNRFDWLMYRHWRCYPSPKPRTEEAPVADNYAYNQGLSRQLHEVTDLLLRGTVDLDEQSELAWILHDGRERFRVVLSASEELVSLRRSGRIVKTFDLPNLASGPTVFEAGIIDWQVLLAIEGTSVVEYSYQPLDVPSQPTTRPMGIGGRGAPVRVSEMKLFRDVYYRSRSYHHQDWASRRLQEGEFVLLGDNVPRSRDSRHWPGSGVNRKSFIGKVLRFE